MPNPSNSDQPGLVDKVIDLAALIGAGAITYGVDLIYHPAAFIVGGTMLLTGAWLSARRGA